MKQSIDMKELRQSLTTWAAAFRKSATKPLSDAEVDSMFGCLMAEGKPNWPPEALKQQMGYQIAQRRLNYMGVDAHESVPTFLACVCDRPGTMVMYIMAIGEHWLTLPEPRKKFGMGDFTILFPKGLHYDMDLSKAWDGQKVGGANMLDQALALFLPLESSDAN